MLLFYGIAMKNSKQKYNEQDLIRLIFDYYSPYHYSIIKKELESVKTTTKSHYTLHSLLLQAIDTLYAKPTLYIDSEFKADNKPTNMAMYCLPVQSSGDIYHIAAYIALAMQGQYRIPNIFWAYDANTTAIHATRAIEFAKQIGMGEFIEVLDVINGYGGGYQANQRQNKVLKALSASGFKYFIDQKLTTSMVSYSAYINSPELTTSVIRNQFEAWKNILPVEDVKQIREYVCNSLSNLLNKSVVVFHHRHNAETNDKQNLSQTEISSILGEYSKHTTLHVQAGAQPIKSTSQNVINFDPFAIKQPRLAKLAHLYLCCKLYKLNHSGKLTIAQVVGNTSGTLDLAAFVGLPVLDLHKFKTPQQCAYQDIRLLQQTTFMNVNSRDDKQLNKLNINGGLGANGLNQMRAIYSVDKKSWIDLRFPNYLFNKIITNPKQTLITDHFITEYNTKVTKNCESPTKSGDKRTFIIRINKEIITQYYPKKVIINDPIVQQLQWVDNENNHKPTAKLVQPSMKDYYKEEKYKPTR